MCLSIDLYIYLLSMHVCMYLFIFLCVCLTVRIYQPSLFKFLIASYSFRLLHSASFQLHRFTTRFHCHWFLIANLRGPYASTFQLSCLGFVFALFTNPVALNILSFPYIPFQDFLRTYTSSLVFKLLLVVLHFPRTHNRYILALYMISLQFLCFFFLSSSTLQLLWY